MLTVVAVEIVNIFVLTTNFTTMAIIMNFMALIVLVEFDNLMFSFTEQDILFEALESGQLGFPEDEDVPNRSLKEIIKVLVTTSEHATLQIPDHKLESETVESNEGNNKPPSYIHIGF